MVDGCSYRRGMTRYCQQVMGTHIIEIENRKGEYHPTNIWKYEWNIIYKPSIPFIQYVYIYIYIFQGIQLEWVVYICLSWVAVGFLGTMKGGHLGPRSDAGGLPLRLRIFGSWDHGEIGLHIYWLPPHQGLPWNIFWIYILYWERERERERYIYNMCVCVCSMCVWIILYRDICILYIYIYTPSGRIKHGDGKSQNFHCHVWLPKGIYTYME